jgi:hypothetical protein
MLIKSSEPWSQTAEQAATRRGYAAKSELRLRSALEEFCRGRWPDARIVHEIVMGERRVRADVAAIGPAHIAAFEIKGEYDDTTRLLHQVGMYQLCVPEVWMVVPVGRHAEDARLIRHLIPSVGLLVGAGTSAQNHYEFDGKELGLVVEEEAVPRPVIPELMLEMLWRDELAAVCIRTRRYSVSPKSTRPAMIKALLAAPIEEIQREVCTELRARVALWRADEPIDAAVRPPRQEVMV